MERLVAEEISGVLTGVAGITGQVEKLVRGRWTDRWLTVCVEEASIHYYLSKSDQLKGKVRGIYPLQGVRLKENYVVEDNGPYEFCLIFPTGVKIHFRTNVKNQSHAWRVIISHLAAKLPEKQGEATERTLAMKSGMGWTKVLARLDTDLRELSLVKVGHHDENTPPKEEVHNLGGAKMRPLKSYGKTFEFIICMRSSNKHLELRFKASSELERTEWCQALQNVIENGTELMLYPNSREGLDEGTIYLAEKSVEMPSGKEVNEVVLKGLQAFSPKVMTRVKYYLQPYPIIHSGEVSKVYNANLKFVSLALMNAGFLPGIQDTTSNLVFEMKAQDPVTLESRVTIDDIVSVLLPVRFPLSTSLTQSGDLNKPSDQSSAGLLNVSSSSSYSSSSSSSPSSSSTSLSLPPSPCKKPSSPSLRLKNLITKR